MKNTVAYGATGCIDKLQYTKKLIFIVNDDCVF